MTLYEVLFEILDKNWKFFYKSPVIYSFGDVKPSEPLSHQPEFIAILHVGWILYKLVFMSTVPVLSFSFTISR